MALQPAEEIEDDEPFDDKIKGMAAELEEQFVQSAQLEQVIRESAEMRL